MRQLEESLITRNQKETEQLTEFESRIVELQSELNLDLGDFTTLLITRLKAIGSGDEMTEVQKKILEAVSFDCI